MPIKSIKKTIYRRSIFDELVEHVRNMILDDELIPGEKFPEKTLTEQFGVSRTPMREAIKVLAMEGYIHIIPHKGAFISPLTLEGLEEVMPILGSLESLAGTLACKNISDDKIKAIRVLHDRMLKEFQDGNRKTYFDLNQKIHSAILEASGNSILCQMHRNLAGRVHRVRYLANMSQDRWETAVQEHEVIIEALEGRDEIKLSSVLESHLKNKLQTVRDNFAAKGEY